MFNLFRRDKGKKKKKSTRGRGARKQNSGRARAFLWWLIGICTALIFLMVFVLSDHGLYQLYQLKKEQRSIEERIARLEKENARLAEERDRLEDDLEYIEKLARERYRMAKEGEKVFRVVPEDTRSSQ